MKLDLNKIARLIQEGWKPQTFEIAVNCTMIQLGIVVLPGKTTEEFVAAALLNAMVGKRYYATKKLGPPGAYGYDEDVCIRGYFYGVDHIRIDIGLFVDARQ